jgi:DNA-binding cell septation regulator SpoVG
MPRRKREGAPPQDLAHPLDIETRRFIEERVLSSYQEVAGITSVDVQEGDFDPV